MRNKLKQMCEILGLNFNTKDKTAVFPKRLAKVLSQKFDEAADLWVEGNNSGNDEKAGPLYEKCHAVQAQCENALAVLDITVDYPGLYPTFKFGTSTRDYGSLLSILNEALEHANNRNENEALRGQADNHSC